MSDAILNGGQDHYYYVGSDRFPFASGSGAEPIEDALGQPAEESIAAFPMGASLGAIAMSRRERISSTMSFAASITDFCSGLLRSMEERYTTGEVLAASHQADNASGSDSIQDNVQPELPEFPRSQKIGRDTWETLFRLAQSRLSEEGCLITQRDKNYLSSSSGVEITPYIWSTLVHRMNLRRVKNPYSSSALVIYVPRA